MASEVVRGESVSRTVASSSPANTSVLPTTTNVWNVLYEVGVNVNVNAGASKESNAAWGDRGERGVLELVSRENETETGDDGTIESWTRSESEAPSETRSNGLDACGGYTTEPSMGLMMRSVAVVAPQDPESGGELAWAGSERPVSRMMGTIPVGER